MDQPTPQPDQSAPQGAKKGQDRPEHPQSMAPTMVLCPYCGSLSTHQKQCSNCGGYFDLLSRQRSQNAMGPWFIRDVSKPFQPGCSYSTLVKMIQRGKIKPETVIRGPATRQFWTFARNAPGIAHLLGECHSCHAPVMPIAKLCPMCRASFVVDDDRQHMGLSPVHLLPGDADAATIAASLSNKVAAPAAETTPATQAAAPNHPDSHAVASEVSQSESEHADANQAATQTQVVAERAAHPAPSFPEPEVKVILDEDEKSGSRAGLVVSIVIAFIVVAGAGFWAWSYLSARATSDSTPVVETSQADQPTGSDAVGGEQDALESETLVPTEGQLPDNEAASVVDDIPEPVEVDSDLEESTRQPQQTNDTATNQRDNAQQLAFDRALIGIADGTLDEVAFRAVLDEVLPQQREALEEMWVRRQNQVRLGRDGD